MPSHATKTQEEATGANREALRGGLVGASRWGLLGLGLAFAGYLLSPIYRNLTIQFKVYLQLSVMSLGGFLEADNRLRAYEAQTRLRRKQQHDAAVWKKWEGLLDEEERLEKLQEQQRQQRQIRMIRREG